jgi:spore germination protein KB
MGDFLQLTLMEETPRMVITLMCVIVLVMAVRGGVKLVTRYSPIFVLTTSFILIISIIMIFNQLRFQNLLPMFDLPFIKYVQGTHIITLIPFGETVIFLMIHPSVSLTAKETKKYLFGGFAIGAAVMAILMVRDVAMLGNTLDMFTLPSLTAWYLINLGPALSRMEIFFFIILIILLFFRIVLLFYVSVLSVAHLFKTRKIRHLALVISVFLMFYGFTLYPCSVEHAASARNFMPFIWLPFEVILPVLTYFIVKLRRRHEKTWPQAAAGKEQP